MLAFLSNKVWHYYLFSNDQYYYENCKLNAEIESCNKVYMVSLNNNRGI